MTATCSVSTVDAFLARLALSLWTSSKRVEPLPAVRVWEPYEIVNIVPMRWEPRYLTRSHYSEGI